jgi:hypothetical protein
MGRTEYLFRERFTVHFDSERRAYRVEWSLYRRDGKASGDDVIDLTDAP